MNLYKGVIVAILSDNERKGVIKCTVDGLYNSDDMGNIDLDLLPKLYPIHTQGQNNFDTPKEGEEVFVFLDRNNKYSGFWMGKYSLSDSFTNFISSRYEGFKSIKFDDEENLRCYYSRDNGLILELDDSRVIIKDDEIKLETPDRKFHVKNGMISVGQLDRSNEPATLGDKNVTALNEISTEVDKLCTTITTFCAEQSAVTKSVQYLAPLTAAYDKMAASIPAIQAIINGKIKAVSIPATKSTKTSLD